MQLAWDGNNSAKRTLSAGLQDHCPFESNYFLPHTEVDRFSNEVKRRPVAVDLDTKEVILFILFTFAIINPLCIGARCAMGASRSHNYQGP